jgi:hypothetical protein
LSRENIHFHAIKNYHRETEKKSAAKKPSWQHSGWSFIAVPVPSVSPAVRTLGASPFMLKIIAKTGNIGFILVLSIFSGQRSNKASRLHDEIVRRRATTPH